MTGESWFPRSSVKGGTRIFHRADLPAGETRPYRLVRVREELLSSLSLKTHGSVAELTNGQMGLRLAWEGSERFNPYEWKRRWRR